MMKQKIIQHTIDFVKETLAVSESGHDWWHIYRVHKSAVKIAQNETGADLFVVELGALLHDIADSKFHAGNEEIGPQIAHNFLSTLNVEPSVIEQVVSIIKNISFKHSFTAEEKKSLELQIIQDADRLDAIGAIGIARAFSYGGYKMREMYNPEIKPVQYTCSDDYKKNTAPTINHFYEKLLLLKDQINTAYGRKLAIKRHKYMEEYLKHFYAEWEGEI